MKKIPFLLILLLVVGNLLAQTHKKDVVVLKDGTNLKGHFVRVDNDKIVVQSGRNIWIFNNDQIDSIISATPVKSADLGSPVLKRPYYLKTTFGELVGNSASEKQSPFSFDASFNYGIVTKFYTGVGMGVDFLENSYMPVFLNLEYRFRDTRFTPFVGVKGGYLIPLDDGISSTIYYDYYPATSSYWPYYPQEELKDKGGLMVNPSFGFVSYINDNLGLSLGIGYRYHEITFKGDNHYQLDKSYNRLTIRLGILFN